MAVNTLCILKNTLFTSYIGSWASRGLCRARICDRLLVRAVLPFTNQLSITPARFLCDSAKENETVDISKDRTRVIPVETSIRYLKSNAYKQTYGSDPVWVMYKRNHKGMYPPKKTRKTCIRQGAISTGNPCPICRDEYLVLDYRNQELLKQFISPHTGEIFSYSKTGICQKRHKELLIALEKAKDYGFIKFDVPMRVYDYSEYYNKS